MKKISVFLCAISFSGYLYSQHSIGVFDEASGILDIPNVVLRDKLFTSVRLLDDGNGMFDIVAASRNKNASVIPVNASFIFLDSFTIVIPIVQVGDEYHYNQIYSISPSLKLSLKSEDYISDQLMFQDGEVAQVSSALVVSSALSDVKYPKSYNNVSGLPVNLVAPECNLLPAAHVYPSDYLGNSPLPKIVGAPFDNDIDLVVSLKDFWQVGNPSFNNGCSGDVRENFTKLLNDANQLNADFIEIIPWTFIDDRTSVWKVLTTDELIALTGTSIPTDEDLVWMVQAAKSKGLKVRWRNQIQGNVASQIPEANADNIGNFVQAYEDYMVERADFLNGIGVDEMQVDCICWFPWYTENPATSIFFDSLNQLIPELANHFEGGFYANYQPHYLTRSGIIDNLDSLFLDLSGYYESDAGENPLADKFKQDTVNILNGIFFGFSPDILNRINITFEVGSPSRVDFFANHESVEETFCTSSFNTISQEGDECIQKNQVTDFGIQAQAIEGIFEALQEQTLVPNFKVSAQGYWITPSVMPGSTFPNIAFSVRGKPAEKIIQTWFKE